MKWKPLSHVRLLQPHKLYSSWNSLGQNTGVSSLPLLQGIFPTQGSSPDLPHCRQIIYQLSHQGNPNASDEWLHSAPAKSLLNVALTTKDFLQGFFMKALLPLHLLQCLRVCQLQLICINKQLLRRHQHNQGYRSRAKKKGHKFTWIWLWVRPESLLLQRNLKLLSDPLRSASFSTSEGPGSKLGKGEHCDSLSPMIPLEMNHEVTYVKWQALYLSCHKHSMLLLFSR